MSMASTSYWQQPHPPAFLPAGTRSAYTNWMATFIGCVPTEVVHRLRERCGNMAKDGDCGSRHILFANGLSRSDSCGTT